MDWKTRIIRNIPEILATLLLLVAIAAIIRQAVVYDGGFCIYQASNHETIVVGCVIGAAGLLLGKYLSKRGK